MEDPNYERLKAEVTEMTTVADSAVALINGLAQRLRDALAAAADLESLRAAIGAEADALDASGNALAEAVAAIRGS